uniref:Uncharacterized protein n=1 Tax=Rhodnius prolixus TaxID=13249 RepID=T1HKX0_RHOPR
MDAQSAVEGYLHNFLSDLWSYLTPDIIDTLKDMLVLEFGMKPRDAEIFLLDQRLKTLFKGASQSKPMRLPCFPFPPDCPAPSPGLPCLPFASQLPEGFPFCPPPFPPPCPPPGCPSQIPPPCCIPTKKPPMSLPCIPFPCPPFPCGPPPATYPCCSSPSRITCNGKKKSKKKMKGRKTLGLRNYWVKELTSTLTIKLNDYLAMLLSNRRSKRVKAISEAILKHLIDITGEECTLNKANTRAQKLMVLIADRLAMWLANISCTCDAAMKEICEKKKEEELSKLASTGNDEDPNKTSGKKADKGGDKSKRKRNDDSDNPSGKKASDEGKGESTDRKSVSGEPKETDTESKDKIEGGGEGPKEAIEDLDIQLYKNTEYGGLAFNEPRPRSNKYISKYQYTVIDYPRVTKPRKVSSKPDVGLFKLERSGSIQPKRLKPEKKLVKYNNDKQNKRKVSDKLGVKQSVLDKRNSEKIVPKENIEDVAEIKEKEQVDNLLKEVITEIRMLETSAPRERAEEIAALLNEKLGQKLDFGNNNCNKMATYKILNKFSQGIGAWIDGIICEAEEEYGRILSPAEKALAIYSREETNYLRKHLSTELILLNMNELKQQARSDQSKKVKLRVNNESVTEENKMEGSNFVSGLNATIQQWIKWPYRSTADIDNDAYIQGDKFVTNEEMLKWKIGAEKHALKWKQNKEYLKEAARIWRQKIQSKYIKSGQKTAVNNTK